MKGKGIGILVVLFAGMIMLCSVTGAKELTFSSTTDQKQSATKILSLKYRLGHFLAPMQRKSCSDYYPASGNFTECTEIGRSGCGGPEQCYCGPKERLVSYRCKEGYLNTCRDVGGC